MVHTQARLHTYGSNMASKEGYNTEWCHVFIKKELLRKILAAVDINIITVIAWAK